MGNICKSKEKRNGEQNSETKVRATELNSVALVSSQTVANGNRSPGTLAIALYPLHTQNKAVIDFEEGDRVIIEDDSDPDWYLVRHVTNQARGFAPKSYFVLDTEEGNEEWFFGDTSRADAERLLLQPDNVTGTFMIRNSGSGSYALSVKDFNPAFNEISVKHYKIRTTDQGGFFVAQNVIFSSLRDLVAYYTAASNGLCCKLEYACPRPRPIILGPLPDARDEYEIPFESLQFIRQLGKGNFGEVFYGYWNGTLEVAIKRLTSEGVQMEEFRREVAVMKAIKHPKIVRLHAICTERAPFCIVMEYLCNGNLQQYLKSSHGKKLRLPSLVNIAAQIADGMMFLESNNLIHRDLAARNILVGDNDIVKLADFGLARIVDEAVYITTGGKLPIRWTAPEAFTEGQFTIKSDVWSYGIVLYEIFTHGEMPYKDMKNSQVSHLVSKQNYRMPKPNDPECHQAVYEIMLTCWKKEPKDRPTFDFLHHFFIGYTVTSEASYREA